jgi:hypothetical protein
MTIVAKTGFFQESTIVTETVGDLTETVTDTSSTDDKAKSSFYQSQQHYEEAEAAADILSEIEQIQEDLEQNSLVVRMGLWFPGTPSEDEELFRYTFTDTVEYPADLGVTQANARTAATAETVFSIQKDDVEFATITFEAASDVGTMGTSDATTFIAGETLSVVAPSSVDSTLAYISMTLAANRVTS